MSNRIRKIVYKDHEILEVDLSNAEEVEIIDTLDSVVSLLQESGTQNNRILTLLDGTFVFGSVLTKAKESMKKMRPYTHKRAMLGLSRPKQVLLRAANIFAGGNPTQAFDTREEALDYLVS